MPAIRIAKEDHGKPGALQRAIKRASRVEQLKEALQVARVAVEQLKADSITDAEIRRVALAKIDHALNL